MEWKKFNKDFFTSDKKTEIRSIILPDESGNMKRSRISTFWNLEKPAFTKNSAEGKLLKDKEGKIGAIIIGKNGGYLKIGRLISFPQYIFVPLSSLSKKALKNLLEKQNIEIFREDNVLFGIEIN
jgi:hypothetical protein